MRWIACLVTGFLLLFSVSVMLEQPATTLLPKVPGAHAASISITLTGCVIAAGTCTSAGWWEGTTKDPIITVTTGDTITLHLSSADRITHQFIVDVDGSGICSTTDPCSSMFTSSTTMTFTASMASGTYLYGCTIHPQMAVAGGFKVNSALADFSITANPPTVSTKVGVLGNSTIAVAPQGSFTGTIGLTATTNSTNLSCTLSPTIIPGGSGSSMLSCTSNVPANYLVNVTGTSGSLSHLTSLVYHVTSGTVGGAVVQVDKLWPLTLYIGLGFATASLLAAVLIHVRRQTP